MFCRRLNISNPISTRRLQKNTSAQLVCVCVSLHLWRRPMEPCTCQHHFIIVNSNKWSFLSDSRNCPGPEIQEVSAPSAPETIKSNYSVLVFCSTKYVVQGSPTQWMLAPGSPQGPLESPLAASGIAQFGTKQPKDRICTFPLSI